MSAQPFILFVPAYGRGGYGEFVRAVLLAQATKAHWPQMRIEFLLPGGPGTRTDAPFPSICHDGDATTKGQFDLEHIERLRPDLVIFDSACRSPTLRHCRRLGIRTAYVTSLVGGRRKAFRLDWLWLLDEHWHQREDLTAAPFTPWQRLLDRLGRTRRRVFDTCFSDAAPDFAALPVSVQPLLDQDYVLFSPGGGGYRIGDRPVAEIFLEAAEQLQAQSGLPCLMILGPLYAALATAKAGESKVHCLVEVPQATFMGLMRKARLVVTNGGHSLDQALASGAISVAAALGGTDQPGRIAAYRDAGWVLESKPDAASLVAAAQALLGDPAREQALRKTLGELKVANGIPVMLGGIAHLLRLPA